MKTTRGKHLLRSIRKGGVSFLAVAVIAAVCIANYHGFQSSADAILRRADQYFTDNNLETLEITCANGITAEDLDAVASWEGVTAVEGGYTDSVVLRRGESGTLVQARSLTDTVNLPVVVEGTLPAAADEAAVEEYLAEQEGVRVGDTITLEQDGCLIQLGEQRLEGLFFPSAGHPEAQSVTAGSRAAEVRFRPEDGHWRSEKGQGNCFPAQTILSTFEGSCYRVKMRTESGEEFCILHPDPIPEQTRGYVHVEKEKLYVYESA